MMSSRTTPQAVCPADIIFSHKAGIQAKKKSYADSGIVYAKDRPYILTIMLKAKTDKTSEDNAKKLMREISAQVYDYVANASL